MVNLWVQTLVENNNETHSYRSITSYHKAIMMLFSAAYCSFIANKLPLCASVGHSIHKPSGLVQLLLMILCIVRSSRNFLTSDEKK